MWRCIVIFACLALAFYLSFRVVSLIGNGKNSN
jgi:hypothetical protein